MALSDTDLLLVQRGTVPYKDTVDNLASYVNSKIDVSTDVPIASPSQLGVIRVGANLSIDANGVLSAGLGGAITFKGDADFTAAAPTGPVVGDLWMNSTAGTGAWLGFAGEAVALNDRAVFNGTEWYLIAGDGSSIGTVQDITQTAPIVVTEPVPGEFNISITQVAPSVANAGGTDGYMTAQDKEKLDSIEAGAEVNVDPTQTFAATADLGTLTLTPGGDTTNIPAATSTEAGLMTAADKVTLDNLVSSPGGVQSVLAGDGISVNTTTAPGSAGTPEIAVKFAGTGADDTTLVLPANLSLLEDLP